MTVHYAWLKGVRDRSLVIFALIPPMQFTAMVIGFSLDKRHLTYPFIGPDWAGDFPGLAILIPAVVGSCSAFWMLRSEVATRAIDSFVVASRPVAVIAALVVTGTVTAAAGWLGGLAAILMLTADLPANLLTLASSGALAALAGASLGALYVTILPQPGMLVWAVVAGLPLGPWIFDPASRSHLIPIALVVSIVAMAASTFLLRRRCAS
jgi:hypothetical protein